MSSRSYSSSSYGSSAQSQRKATSEKNQQTLKALLKDPGNKFCADCKTAGHPRWASWNLGIFLCIRCSGIHRSLGTHISRVRSVDLDSWSDDQLSNMIKWGNRRANIYWEHALPNEYVPTEGRIANFIRTKYELKRWVLSQQVPDPASLDTESPSSSAPAATSTPPPRVSNESTPLAQVKKSLVSDSKPTSASLIPDLLGDSAAPPSASPTVQTRQTSVSSSTNSSHFAVPPPVPSKATTAPKPSSLLGDFGDFTSSPPTPARSASQSPSNQSSKPSSVAANGRQDLKKSILSLYAPQAATNVAPVPTTAPPHTSTTSSAFDSMNSGFSGLNFGSSTTATAPPASHSPHDPFAFASQTSATTKSPTTDIFGALTSPTSSTSTSNGRSSFSRGSSSYGQQPAQQQHQQHQRQPSAGFGTTPWSTTTTASSKPMSNNQNDNEWATFSSAPPLKSKPAPIEDDVFANVWK